MNNLKKISLIILFFTPIFLQNVFAQEEVQIEQLDRIRKIYKEEKINLPLVDFSFSDQYKNQINSSDFDKKPILLLFWTFKRDENLEGKLEWLIGIAKSCKEKEVQLVTFVQDPTEEFIGFVKEQERFSFPIITEKNEFALNYGGGLFGLSRAFYFDEMHLMKELFVSSNQDEIIAQINSFFKEKGNTK